MDEKKEEQKNDIILVVKKAIGDKIEIDDIIDSEDVDIIAKKVADRLYMDGWRKENPQGKSKDEEEQIEGIRKVVSFNCNKEGIAKRCPERIANGIYEASYRKADEVIDEFIERLKEENKISFRRYGKSIGMTDIFRIADEMKFELFKQREKNNG